MKELKDADPLYQGAYDELRKAIDFLGRGDYAEAVINAGKSYESVLKVICGPGPRRRRPTALLSVYSMPATCPSLSALSPRPSRTMSSCRFPSFATRRQHTAPG